MIRAARSRLLQRQPTAPARNFPGPRRCEPPRRNYNSTRPGRGATIAVVGYGAGVVKYGVVPYGSFWQACITFPKRKPFATNLIVATVKTCLADLLVQSAQKKKEDGIDWKRNAVFTMFGFGYSGAFQWFVYVTVFSRLCPNAMKFANMSFAEKLKFRAGQIDLVKQTLADNFLHFTFIYFPVFYTFKECIQGPGGQSPWGTFTSAMQKYTDNFVQDNLMMWALWIPCDLLIYSVPLWLRMPLNHGVSLVWTMILSAMRGA